MAAETILIVDDDQIMVELLAIWLEEAGYATATASDEATAVSTFASLDGVVAIICDFELRGGKGYSVIEAIQSLSPGLKAIMISGHSEQRIRSEGTGAVTHFLQKPFDPSELMEIIEQR